MFFAKLDFMFSSVIIKLSFTKAVKVMLLTTSVIKSFDDTKLLDHIQQEYNAYAEAQIIAGKKSDAARHKDNICRLMAENKERLMAGRKAVSKLTELLEKEAKNASSSECHNDASAFNDGQIGF
jgi:hypothetical protein